MTTGLRYVVLHHQGIAQPHFDFMFETAPGSKLATYRAPRWPITSGDALQRLGEHRREYLEYEGPLTANRGHVRRVAAGICSVETDAEQICVQLDTGATITVSASA